MSRSHKLRCLLYVAIAVLALLATGRQNSAFTSGLGLNFVDGFAAFWAALFVNHATASITVDIFLFGLAAVAWMMVEARKLGIRFVWLYILLGLFVAISVTFPLFLVARERALTLGSSLPERPIGVVDYLGLGILTLGTTALAIYCIIVV